MAADLKRALVTEALGTGLLVAAVVGSGIMAQQLTDDTGLALLANSVATGAVLFVLITVLGPLSGAHFNPLVSSVMALRGELKQRTAAGYVLAQCAGGLVGTLVAHAMFAQPLLQVSTQMRSGGGQWLAEGVATFGLLLTILGGLKARPAAIPGLVGLYIVGAYWFTASTSFANPAVTLARTVTQSFAGIAPADAPGFILAQTAGAALAALLAGWLFDSKTRAMP